MCYECHGTPEETLAELKDTFASGDFKFDAWNTTSVNHLLISMGGQDGPECKQLATQLLTKFVEWYETNRKDNYFPEYEVEQMLSLECLQGLIQVVKDNPDSSNEEINKTFMEPIAPE